MTVTPDEPQVLAEVDAILNHAPDATCIAIRSGSGWKGSSTLTVRNHVYRVREAASPLAVREALADAEEEGQRLILLTEADEHDLGLDVVARLYHGTVRRLRSWDAVKTLMKAREVDPNLLREPHLSAWLLDVARRTGMPAPNGVLTADYAWEQLFIHELGLPPTPSDLPRLLLWTAGESFERFLAAPDDLVESATHYLEGQAGLLVRFVLGCVRSGRGGAALPLGLVCRVVFSAGAPELRAAAARLERWVGGQPIPESVAHAWADAAEKALDGLRVVNSPRAREACIEAADDLLREVRADAFAWISPLSGLGLKGRLIRFAQSGTRLLDTGQGLPDVEAAYKLIAGSQLAAPRQVEAAAMAVRLARWLTRHRTPATSLSDSSLTYVENGAFVDLARYKLSGGDVVPELGSFYARLLESTTRQRETENRLFGQLLAGWNNAPDQKLLGVEQILTEVVLPLMKGAERVLLVVLDGLSWAVAHEIAGDMESLGWSALKRNRSRIPPVLAALPSITEASRTSLLSGALLQGDASTEKAGFCSHPELKAACLQGYPPCLYHKPMLASGEAGHLDEELVDRIVNRDYKLVGVVVNAIDDTLTKDEQVRRDWTVDAIRPLGALLQHARRGQRVVVIASDHGHVLEQGTELRSHGGAARWYVPHGPVAENEIEVSGGRVVPAERVALPVSERVRYAQKRAGYHGGATPQEVLAPLLVTTVPPHVPKGWQTMPLLRPSWWDAKSIELRDLPEIPRAPQSGQAELVFEESAVPDWVSGLLAAADVEMLTRHGLTHDFLRTLLSALAVGEGRFPLAALARYFGQPEPALRQLLAHVETALSRDGQPVLRMDFDGQTVLLEAPSSPSRRVAVTTVMGDSVQFDVPSELTEAERKALDLTARYGRVTEAQLRQLLGTRRITGLMEVLIGKLQAFGVDVIRAEGSGDEGVVYAFHRERIAR